MQRIELSIPNYLVVPQEEKEIEIQRQTCDILHGLAVA